MKKGILLVLWIILFELVTIGLVILFAILTVPEMNQQAGRDLGQKFGLIILFGPTVLAVVLSKNNMLPGTGDKNEN